MYCADNDIDGSTLLGLTESMISRLLPTMKLQVTFNKMLAELLKNESGAAVLTSNGSASTSHVVPTLPRYHNYNCIHFVDCRGLIGF